MDEATALTCLPHLLEQNFIDEGLINFGRSNGSNRSKRSNCSSRLKSIEKFATRDLRIYTDRDELSRFIGDSQLADAVSRV